MDSNTYCFPLSSNSLSHLKPLHLFLDMETDKKKNFNPFYNIFIYFTKKPDRNQKLLDLAF